MKIVKLIVGVAAIAALMSTALGTPANAQFRGVRYARSNNVPDTRFSLVFRTPDGQDILDSNPASNSGFFTGAIEEFFYLGGVNPFTGSSPISFSFPLGNLSSTLTGDIVTYTLLSQNPFNITDNTDFDAPVTTNVNPGPIFTFDFNVSGFNQAIRNRYVNDLQFIAESQVYRFAQSSSFVESTLGYDLAIATDTLEITEVPDTSIPEPSTTAALLAFGVFGVSSFFKRKAVQN